ncbi:hypothetical protein EZV62_013622 [Acer yangbiense]|uniref:WRKY domain-containing protein n=1 Tax=Acer yangbiense TaxID=1000413 RepID=A0A5C7HZY3_9ROSI|nr:hypothetical protein EZV62_013622 [Acer yangbiense]
MDAHVDTSTTTTTTTTTQKNIEGLLAKLEHVRKENESLRYMVEIMNDKCNNLQSQIRTEQQMKYTNYLASYYESIHKGGRPTLAEVPISKTSKIYVKTHVDDKTLVVKDGYQWRKYGQKVTKDNPSPRAYFRCSMAPRCPVKKKVQRCMEDKRYLVATYDGEHNHDVDCSIGRSFASAKSSSMAGFPSPETSNTSRFQSNIALDLTLSGSSQEKKRPSSSDSMEDYDHHNKKMKIEEYVASLTKDSSFTIALAAAVASSITDLPKPTIL